MLTLSWKKILKNFLSNRKRLSKAGTNRYQHTTTRISNIRLHYWFSHLYQVVLVPIFNIINADKLKKNACCLGTSCSTDQLCCVFRPPFRCLCTRKLVKLLFFSAFLHNFLCFQAEIVQYGYKNAEKKMFFSIWGLLFKAGWHPNAGWLPEGGTPNRLNYQL